MLNLQMESIPPKWGKCDYACYMNFFVQYMAVHENLARNIGKPLVLEEVRGGEEREGEGGGPLLAGWRSMRACVNGICLPAGSSSLLSKK